MAIVDTVVPKAAAPCGPEDQGNITLHNWNLSLQTHPACVVIAKDKADIQRIIMDCKTYPTPVIAVGSMHSVTPCLVNNGGTIISVSNMNKIIGLVGSGDQAVVKVETGVKLVDLHKWLAEKGYELSFSPEIGDATVGSLVVTTSKDSSIDGLGYLSALVCDVTYVDDQGNLVSLSQKESERLVEFTCSYGLMGIVVEVGLVCRKLTPVKTLTRTIGYSKNLGKKIEAARRECDNMFVIINPGRYVYLEQRWRVESLGFKAAMTANMLRFTKNAKYRNFLRGAMAKFSGPMRWNRFPMFHYRHEFVNQYPAVTDKEKRLDFSFYEFDLPNIEQVVGDLVEFAASYKKRNDFLPSGFAMYFVKRSGEKPSGSFSGQAGTSFMLDPIYHSPTDPRWSAFCEEMNEWAIKRGANVSLSQTKGLKPHQAQVDPALVRRRFLTPYYAEFLPQY